MFENHLSLERIFDKCWTPGLYENMWEFNITASMVTQKYEEDNGKEKGNLQNMEVCKVGGEGGCGDQDKDKNMLMAQSFGVLE